MTLLLVNDELLNKLWQIIVMCKSEFDINDSLNGNGDMVGMGGVMGLFVSHNRKFWFTLLAPS